MKISGYFIKFSMILLILDYTCLYSHCSLVENVNEAIIAIFHDEIKNEESKTNEIEAFVKLFIENQRGDDTAEIEIKSVKAACSEANNVSICGRYLSEQCLNLEELVRYSRLESENQTLLDWFPPVLYNLHSLACKDQEPESEEQEHTGKQKPSSAQAWGYGIGFVTLICAVANVGGCMAPFMKKAFFQKVLMFCVALAVGTLASTGFLVLIPESMHLTEEDSPVPDYHHKMATVMGGVYFFYISERLLKIWFSRPKKRKEENIDVSGENVVEKTVVVENDHGHSHLPDFVETVDVTDESTKLPVDETEKIQKVKRKRKVTTVALMILIGDALHNFVDGIAIGAAFTENTYLGISVSLSVVCEELPHELGDIAILLHTGLNMRRSLCYNFVAALPIYIGLALGIVLGENTNANTWIFAVAGGMFVYLSLVDMIPEMVAQVKYAEEMGTESKWAILFVQNIGLLAGFVIILMLVMFGGNIEV